MRYGYFFKGSFYFKKRIHRKHLKNRDKDLIYRRSLRKCIDVDFYNFLEVNNHYLDKLFIYLNKYLTIRLKMSNKESSVTDINIYIEELCENYKKEAQIENSILEEKRIRAIEYIDMNGNGMQDGYLLQALTKKFKEIDIQYHRLEREPQKTQELGNEILKRSNISMEKVLQIPTDKLQHFYEILIKNERDILLHDIKRYIARNLFQFFPFIMNPTADDKIKIEEAYSKFIMLVQQHPLQSNYIDFINNHAIDKNINNTAENDLFKGLSQDDFIKKIMSKIKENDREKVLETSLEINTLIDNFITYKKAPEREAKYRNSLRFFSEFLKGDDKYKPLKIEDLTTKEIDLFEDLLSDCRPKSSSKELRVKNLFQLVEMRKEENYSRLAENSAKLIDDHIKEFWKYVTTHIDNNLKESLFRGFSVRQAINEKNDDEGITPSKLRCFTNNELQIIIDNIYNDENLHKVLHEKPKYFYSFCFYLFLGTRINEFMNIRLDSIRYQEKNGERIYYIWLNENHQLQKLKNKNAHRNIIIPQLLIDLGFLNYVDKRLKNNDEWLWDFTLKSRYSTISVFFNREISKLFPKSVDNRTNRRKGENLVQMKSLRKNFCEDTFKSKVSDYDTEQNKKRLMGHSEGTTTEVYLGRIEPYIAKQILDSLNDYNLNLSSLKENIRSFYKEIKTDIDIPKGGNWEELSRVKAKRGRKV